MLIANEDDGEDRERGRKKRYARERQEDVAEIGPPPITRKQRAEGDRLRELCRNSLLNFNIHCFPNSTGLKPLGEVQRESIAHDETVIVSGGKICKAEPRGYGKTTRTCNAAIWAGLYEYRRMVPVFSANLEKSKNQIMARWKAELYSNELLFWMFPELIWPFRALENKPQRCASQTYNGVSTHIHWTADRIVFPYIEGFPGAGSALIALPLKSCRGATHTMPDGTVLRPDLAIFDDVQKDEDADNPNTVRKMEELIDHTALMLGGHSQTMSAIMNNTVRQPDDLSETYLKKSSWRRVRYKMLTERATAEKELWLGKYAEIRRDYDPESSDDQKRAHKDALQFYLDHREEMNAGAVVSWDWAYAWNDAEPTEVSAVQHAYNILIDLGESVFASECQNEPIRAKTDLEMLTSAEICAKVTGYERGTVPNECSIITAFTDVQKEHLFWMVVAWTPDFSGYILDYGAWPEQNRLYYARSDVQRKLSVVYPGDESGMMFAALSELGEKLCGKNYQKKDGGALRLSRWCIDGNWRQRTAAVLGYASQSPYDRIITVTQGRGVKASENPFSEAKRAKQWKSQHGAWFWQDGPGPAKWVTFDANFWKTRVHESLALPTGSSGGIQLFQSEPVVHRMIADHLTAEFPVRTEARGRTVYEWDERPNRDNEGLDCLVGCAVGASIEGLRRGAERIARKVKPTRSLADYAKAAGR